MDISEIIKPSLEIIVGTYEQFLIGYSLINGESDSLEKKYSLKQTFTNKSNAGSIRSISSVSKYIAAGSTDEVIRILNLSSRTEHGMLQQQNGTITCLSHFHNYLFSGSEDGTICIFKTGSWICEKTLRAHPEGVIDISIHPSGKLALSIGKDKTLKTWNLIKGRSGYTTNIKGVADAVQWSPEGNFYAVSISNRLDIYSVHSASIVYSFNFGKRISHIAFINEEVVAIAGDSDIVEIHLIPSSKKLSCFIAHKNRLKALIYLKSHKLLFTASNSDGFIKVWSFPEEDYSQEPSLVSEINSTCRITCMTVWEAPIIKKITKAIPGQDKVENQILAEASEDEGGDLNDEENESNFEIDSALDEEGYKTPSPSPPTLSRPKKKKINSSSNLKIKKAISQEEGYHKLKKRFKK